MSQRQSFDGKNRSFQDCPKSKKKLPQLVENYRTAAKIYLKQINLDENVHAITKFGNCLKQEPSKSGYSKHMH